MSDPQQAVLSMHDATTWLTSLRSGLPNFLRHQQDQAVLGYVSYSYSGDLFPNKTQTNLAGSIFALKLYAMLGIRNNKTIQPIINRIHSFQHPNGMFVDPFIARKRRIRSVLSKLKRGQWPDLAGHDYIRAETRQTFSALLLHDDLPDRIWTDIPTTPEAILSFLSRLDWTRPWGAGSHFSHLLFFFSLIHKAKKIDDESFQSAYAAATKFITSIQRKDGSWYTGHPSHRQKINGAMKVISGLVVDDLSFERADRLIDLCLEQRPHETSDACDQINQILVLRYCDQQLDHDYRQEDIQAFCYEVIEGWRDYYHPEQGGFSFHKHHANIRYYGAKISRGLPEPDIHGTVLFTWGLSMMNQLIHLPELEFLHEIKS